MMCTRNIYSKNFKILKLMNQRILCNCLFVHDFSRNLLPTSFDNYFNLCTDLHETDTRRRSSCVFVPHFSSVRYGRKSIRLSSIFKWNYLTNALDKNLLSITKLALKNTITQYFLNSYSN